MVVPLDAGVVDFRAQSPGVRSPPAPVFSGVIRVRIVDNPHRTGKGEIVATPARQREAFGGNRIHPKGCIVASDSE